MENDTAFQTDDQMNMWNGHFTTLYTQSPSQIASRTLTYLSSRTLTFSELRAETSEFQRHPTLSLSLSLSAQEVQVE